MKKLTCVLTFLVLLISLMTACATSTGQKTNLLVAGNLALAHDDTTPVTQVKALEWKKSKVVIFPGLRNHYPQITNIEMTVNEVITTNGKMTFVILRDFDKKFIDSMKAIFAVMYFNEEGVTFTDKFTQRPNGNILFLEYERDDDAWTTCQMQRVKNDGQSEPVTVGWESCDTIEANHYKLVLKMVFNSLPKLGFDAPHPSFE